MAAKPEATAEETTLAVQETAVAVALETPKVFRIGPEKHDYTYTKVAANTFKRRRSAAGWGAPYNECLWLFSDGTQWIACHAPENSTPEQVPSGTPVFAITGNDWMQGGQHRWQHWDAAAMAFKDLGSFETTVFER